MVKNPKLKGKPMAVVSHVGGCILAKSYEAKAMGLKTGMPMHEIKKLCPDLIAIPANFDLYAKCSGQMFEVLKSFSPTLEARSIDEGYIDLSGLRGLYHKNFDQIGRDMQEQVYLKTGLPVSIGIANTKIISKIASDFNKPKGVKVVNNRNIEEFLGNVPLIDIPGIGPNKTKMLEKFGLKNAWDLARLKHSTVTSILDKWGVGVWHELNGERVWKMEIDKKPQKSISKTATFRQRSNSKEIVFAELINNLERATSKLIISKQLAKTLSIFIARSDYKSIWISKKFPFHVCDFNSFSIEIRKMFEAVWRSDQTYRSSGIVFSDLILQSDKNLNFFEDMFISSKQSRFDLIKEELNRKYGDNTITVASKIQKIKREEISLIHTKYNWLGTI